MGQSAKSDCTNIDESDDDDGNEILPNILPQARNPELGPGTEQEGGGGAQLIEGVRRHTRAHPGRVVPSLYPMNF